MSTRHASTDGLSQLTELMRNEPGVQPAPIVDPALRRRRRRRRAIIGGVTVLVLAALLGGYVAYALNAPIGIAAVDAEVPAVTVPGEAHIALSADAASAVSVTGADEYLGPTAGGIWLTGGGQEPRPIASITKLVTALVVLDAKPLTGPGDPGPTLTFDRDDHKLYDKYYVLDATIAAMPAGSSMPLHDALEAMLVVSACNYAEAVANWAFGSQSAFLRAARNWLAANGLAGTTIVEPTGIDARNTSTPSDLIALGKLAMANPAVAEIVAMTSLDAPPIPSMSATNDLLGIDGITGLKTGTLDGSGSNLLFSATMEVGIGPRVGVVGVILGGYSHETVNNDARAMLASIRDGFHRVEVGVRNQEIGTYSTRWGESAGIVLGDTASVLTWSATPVTSTFTLDAITTGKQGDTVGEVTWVAGPNTATAPLVLTGDIEPPDAWWRLTHPFELGE